MRSLVALTLTAASVVPMAASHALEAVAQQPYFQNAGKNLSASLKVDALGGRVVNLSETVTNIIVCNEQGKLWDGATCVAAGGNLTLSCPAGKFLIGITNGNPVCADAPAGADGVDGKDAAVPACTDGEFVTVKDGALACVSSGTRKTVTNLGGNTISWPSVKSSRAVTQTIAIPEDANVLVVQSHCSVLANNGDVYTFISFAPSQLPTYTACHQNGNNFNQTVRSGDSKSFSIPKGATTLALTNWTSGISNPEVASSVVNYTFLKETVEP